MVGGRLEEGRGRRGEVVVGVREARISRVEVGPFLGNRD